MMSTLGVCCSPLDKTSEERAVLQVITSSKSAMQGGTSVTVSVLLSPLPALLTDNDSAQRVLELGLGPDRPPEVRLHLGSRPPHHTKRGKRREDDTAPVLPVGFVRQQGEITPSDRWLRLQRF